MADATEPSYQQKAIPKSAKYNLLLEVRRGENSLRDVTTSFSVFVFTAKIWEFHSWVVCRHPQLLTTE